jgi:hypothetical protein
MPKKNFLPLIMEQIYKVSFQNSYHSKRNTCLEIVLFLKVPELSDTKHMACFFHYG